MPTLKSREDDVEEMIKPDADDIMSLIGQTIASMAGTMPTYQEVHLMILTCLTMFNEMGLIDDFDCTALGSRLFEIMISMDNFDHSYSFQV